MPLGLEKTNFLQRKVTVNIFYKTCSDNTYQLRRESERLVTELESVDKAIELINKENREIERQVAMEKTTVLSLETSAADIHRKVVTKQVLYNLLGS